MRRTRLLGIAVAVAALTGCGQSTAGPVDSARTVGPYRQAAETAADSYCRTSPVDGCWVAFTSGVDAGKRALDNGDQVEDLAGSAMALFNGDPVKAAVWLDGANYAQSYREGRVPGTYPESVR